MNKRQKKKFRKKYYRKSYSDKNFWFWVDKEFPFYKPSARFKVGNIYVNL